MPVPKRKHSRSRRDSKHANKGIKPKAVTGCLNCEAPLAPHTACADCGFYKGKKVLAVKADRTIRRAEARKAEAEAQEKQAAAQQAQQGQ